MLINLEAFQFGDNPQMADELLGLVICGRKTATSWAAEHGLLEGEKVGGKMIVKDSKGLPRVIIESIELSRKTFEAVDDDFARDEGEGDLSLQYWQSEHRAYFKREGTFSENMDVYCQRFRVVEIL